MLLHGTVDCATTATTTQGMFSAIATFPRGTMILAAAFLAIVLLPGCLGRTLHQSIGENRYEIYEDGDIDPEWSDWSFGYTAKNKGAPYHVGTNASSNSRNAYCIDIQKQYGALSFTSAEKIPIDNGTIIDILLRRNGTLEEGSGAEDLSSLQLVLEGVSKDISFMTNPISMLEIIGSNSTSEDTIEQFLDGEYVSVSVNAADLLESSFDGETTFSQISIGSCVAQDSGCESSRTKESVISLCIGSMVLRRV